MYIHTRTKIYKWRWWKLGLWDTLPNEYYLNKIFVSERTAETFKCFIDILHLFEPLIWSFFLTNYICKLTIFQGGDDLWILFLPTTFLHAYLNCFYFSFSSMWCSVSIFFSKKKKIERVLLLMGSKYLRCGTTLFMRWGWSKTGFSFRNRKTLFLVNLIEFSFIYAFMSAVGFRKFCKRKLT